MALFIQTSGDLMPGFEIRFGKSRIMHFCDFQMTLLKMFSEISPTILFFDKMGENLTQCFEIILKIDQNNAFFGIF